jgi:hypothetical protein
MKALDVSRRPQCTSPLPRIIPAWNIPNQRFRDIAPRRLAGRAALLKQASSRLLPERFHDRISASIAPGGAAAACSDFPSGPA